MNRFYLNDCLGSGSFGRDELSAGLVKVTRAFNRIAVQKKLRVEKGWILEKEPGKMVLGSVSLENIVNGMKDKDCKRLFYLYCVNHPIHRFFPSFNDEALLKAEYTFDNADATNAIIAAQNGGILMSLPVANLLKTDILEFVSAHEGFEGIRVPNMHGATDENRKFIVKELLDRNYRRTDGIDKLECLAPVVQFSRLFKERFVHLSPTDKKSIFDRLDDARNGNLLQPLKCNGSVIKHVSQHVAELRIVNPVDIRIYFHEDGDTLYFAKLAFKAEYTGKNDQNDDINHSEAIIEEMMKSEALL